jgi:hypothetical protein
MRSDSGIATHCRAMTFSMIRERRPGEAEEELHRAGEQERPA